MNPDKLEDFIRQNRPEFDDQEPDPAIWDRIGKPKRRIIHMNWRRITWQAAAVVIIFISSYYFHGYMASRRIPEQQKSARELSGDNSPMAQQLAEAEAFYASKIDYTRDEVFRLAGDRPQIREEVNREMVDLDKVFEDLKKDLKDNTDNEEVIEAMIQNYRMKLDILEEMLRQLKQSHETENARQHEENKVKI
jgi:hypothetical protein